MNTGKKGRQAPNKPDCEHCPRVTGSREAEAAELVDEVLGKIGSKIRDDSYKATVGDLLRLLQFKAENRQDKQPKEIKVTWVEPEATSETDE